ncbi:MAG: HlyD family efflux transporter periplasmic adaptor subunit [Methylacidiphilales bacterium]|nr:HlyD family efflux transporter periplasmic adaptor subunit [Candidatus Methylacidiphilales bacterium]NJR14344.1 HlyD family efflux transporter periplasmic adaptor subunit [Calothrix sp. CSU_2_0]
MNGNNRSKQDTRTLLAERSIPNQSKTNLNSYKPQQTQSVILRQSPIWSRAIMITLMALAGFGITWASIAKIEQVIPAAGQLKPEAAVKKVQAPVSGIVKQVYIKDGQKVKLGDLLLVFDTEANKVEIASLNKIRDAIIQESQMYRTLINSNSLVAADMAFLRGNLKPETASLLKSRAALINEINFLQTQINNTTTANLNNEEQQRLQIAKTELASRTASANLEIEQIKKQLSQNEIKINDTKANLNIEQQILAKLENLVKNGAIAQLQYLQQQQKVQTLKAQILQLEEEQKRLEYGTQQPRQELNTTVAVTSKNILDKIVVNKQSIAEIDSQLSKTLLENDKKIAEIDSRIAQTKLNVKYQELRAPVAGTIFDLQAGNPGFVANPSEEILKIVPNENLIAEVFITNKDIGFAREGMKVDVRIDSFPFSEFGDIKGELIQVGSDALPPDQTHQFYRFPAKISLNRQYLDARGKNISLQSGMSITANIKVREERTVMSLFTELFTNQVESLEQVR